MRKSPKGIRKKQPGISVKSRATATDDILHHLAFDKSIQANIITSAGNGKILSANMAACRLLGYSKKELLTKNRATIFAINESSFKKMLKQRTAEGHSIALVTALKKSGKLIHCEITSAVFMDEDGIEKAITTIADLSHSILRQKNIDIKKEKMVAHDIILAQAKSDAGMAENDRWIKYIAQASYDVMWDWDIITGEVYIGDSIEEVFGYALKNNTINFRDLKEILLATKTNRVEENLMKVLASSKTKWNDSYKIKRHDGSVASVTSRASIVRDEGGKATRLIGATQDVSRLLDLQKKLEKQIAIHDDDSEKFLLAAKLSFDVIWDWNIMTNEVFLGDGFEELFGYRIKNNKGNMITDWVNYLHPDDSETVIKELQNVIKSPALAWEHAYRVSRADGSIAKVYVRASIIRHPDGKAYRMIGAMQDLSRQNELEEQLEEEIRLKEKQIEEAMEDAKDTERADIGKELHDNINQLLGASKMYIEMAKKGGENSKIYLNRSSEYTLEAIEEIRKLTKGLTTDIIKNLGLSEAIENLTQHTMEVNSVKIFCALEKFKENSINDKFKLNIYRIVQEELNNILKHAKATKVNISLSQNEKFFTLSVSDNGIGFDTFKKQAGIGVANIKSRAASYQGTADFVSKPGKGCVLTATFPMTAVQLKKNK